MTIIGEPWPGSDPDQALAALVAASSHHTDKPCPRYESDECDGNDCCHRSPADTMTKLRSCTAPDEMVQILWEDGYIQW
jgi:hypothetical protein